MKIKYFAWIKDITNLEEEEINSNRIKNLDELKIFIIEKYPDLNKHMKKEILRDQLMIHNHFLVWHLRL